MNTDRLDKERSFHDDRFSGNETARRRTRKYYSIFGSIHSAYADIISAHCKGKKLLEYGCGTGDGSEQWLNLGAIVTGIDISPEGIRMARERIENTSYEADYFVMDAEDTDFDDDSFDIVVGTGIIHHLNLARSYQEMSRILKPGGHAVFLEPLGHNPLICLYRALTPRMRTEDEHPLKQEDIGLFEQYFDSVDVRYLSLFTLLSVPFRNTSIFEKLQGFLGHVDKAAFLVPFVRKYAWTAIIHASNPRK